MEKIVNLLIFLYRESWIQINDSDHYPVMTSQSVSLVRGFVNWVEEKHISLDLVPPEFWYNFIESSWNLFYETNRSLRHVQPSWIFGVKARERWEKAGIFNDIFNTRRKIIEDLKLDIHSFLYVEDSRKYLKSLNDLEELEKELFFNKPEGFLYCSVNTSLYNPKSEFCSKCNSSGHCLRKLREELPNLYKIRMNP